MTEYLEDIKDAENLEHEYGERYRGWYLIKTFLRNETLPLGESSTVTYDFPVYDYKYQFIMPSKIEFIGGIITYTEAERMLGVFRFPRDKNGVFCTPVSVEKIEEQIRTLTDDEIKSLLQNRSVLTFNAFKIPKYGFEYFFLSNHNFNEIAELKNGSFREQLRLIYRSQLESKISDVKLKIESSPNTLLILENVLNRQWKNLDEVAIATNNIISDKA